MLLFWLMTATFFLNSSRSKCAMFTGSRLKSWCWEVLSSEKRNVWEDKRKYKIRYIYYLSVVVLDVWNPRIAEVFLSYTLTGDFHLNVQGFGNYNNLGKYVFLEMQYEIFTITTKNVKLNLKYVFNINYGHLYCLQSFGNRLQKLRISWVDNKAYDKCWRTIRTAYLRFV